MCCNVQDIYLPRNPDAPVIGPMLPGPVADAPISVLLELLRVKVRP